MVALPNGTLAVFRGETAPNTLHLPRHGPVPPSPAPAPAPTPAPAPSFSATAPELLPHLPQPPSPSPFPSPILHHHLPLLLHLLRRSSSSFSSFTRPADPHETLPSSEPAPPELSRSPLSRAPGAGRRCPLGVLGAGRRCPPLSPRQDGAIPSLSPGQDGDVPSLSPRQDGAVPSLSPGQDSDVPSLYPGQDGPVHEAGQL